jgi:hypothetical protein
MKYYCLLFIIFIELPLYGQEYQDDFKVKYENPTNQLGIGLIRLDYSKKPTVGIYNDSNFSSKYDQWNSEAANMEIYPKFYELDYGVCDFVCLEVNENYYKILIGYNQAKYIKVADYWRLTTWKNLIEESFGVTRKRDSRVSNKLRSSKSEESSEIALELKTHENFCVNSLEGSWLNVKYDCIYATDKYIEFEGQPCINYIDKCDNNKIGWIKWKEEGELLVQIYLRP